MPLVQPKVEEEFTIAPPIPYEKAFEYIIEAGDDIDLNLQSIPNLIKRRGL